MKYSENETRTNPQVCEVITTHGRIKLEHAVAPVLDEITQKEIKTELRPPGVGEPTCTPRLFGGKEDSAMEDEHSIGKGTLSKQFGMAVAAPSPPSVEIDTAKYQKYLDDPSLSEAQREEVLRALWSIMTILVDLGFGVHPAQQVLELEDAGQAALVLDEGAKIDSNELK